MFADNQDRLPANSPTCSFFTRGIVKLMKILGFLAVVGLYSMQLGCGETIETPDAGPTDASLGADSSEILPDAQPTTVCGLGKSETTCALGTEICVIEDLGGTILAECRPLPTGCDSLRDCTNCSSLCQGQVDTCDDDDRDNTISCVCLNC